MDVLQVIGLLVAVIFWVLIRAVWSKWRESRAAPRRFVQPPQVKNPIDAFFDNPGPRNAAARLGEYLASPAADPNNPCWYLFARLAERNPSLITEYEEMFQRKPSEILLIILAQCGNEGTRAMLERTAGQPESLQEKISYLAANWKPRFLRPLETEPATCADLDILWCEYRVTRDLEAVRRIIGVLESPDWFRGKLLDWMMRASSEQVSNFADVLYREFGVVCDSDTREILSRQDLDLRLLMDGFNVSTERVDRLLELLPFRLSKDEIAASSAMTKVSAQWSLASHAQQFTEIHELCRDEAITRKGRCRIALLELLAKQGGAADFREMLNRFVEAAHPERLQERRLELLPEWDRLKLLPIEYTHHGELPPLPSDASARCAAAYEDIRSYSTLCIDQVKENGEVSPPVCTWEAEIERGERFFVRQYAGNDYDDWYSFPGHHFRGPMYQSIDSVEANERRINSTLTCDGYLPMFGVAPERSGIADVGGAKWWYFEYKDAPLPHQSLDAQLGEGPDATQNTRCNLCLWVDPATARLHKAVIVIDDQLFRSHMLTAFNEPVDIFPPPFTIWERTETGS